MDKEVLEFLKRLDQGQKRINENLKNLETKIDEHTQILRALEHSAEVNKAEHDKMSNDIARLKAVK